MHCLIGRRSGDMPSAESAAPFGHFLPEDMPEASYAQWEYFFARHYLPDRTWLYRTAESYQPDDADAFRRGSARPADSASWSTCAGAIPATCPSPRSVTHVPRSPTSAAATAIRVRRTAAATSPATNRCPAASPPMPSAASSPVRCCWACRCCSRTGRWFRPGSAAARAGAAAGHRRLRRVLRDVSPLRDHPDLARRRCAHGLCRLASAA